MQPLNRYLISLSVFILLSGCRVTTISSSGNNSSVVASSVSVSNDTFNYNNYAIILKTYVNNQGLINYRRLQSNRHLLDQFNQSIGEVSLSNYESWNESEKLAFLINAYNAFTLQSIIDQTPIKSSIRDIPGVWKLRKFKIAGQEKTLDNIEHDTIRKEFNEPRIHVALVCAAKSCPILHNEPYTSEKLDQQLHNQVEKFIKSSQGFRIDKEQGKVYLSSIFEWYGDDWKANYAAKEGFTGSETERAVLNFLSNYLPIDNQVYLRQGNYRIDYLNYDWSLNKQ
ncbi:DUF547 domain-containing protein [Aphanothece sacrum]|uniref:DUF547 domain-containing protein n=1 Tax=Aphanothece sacrum FPU1 TaxID=1920663 RepID=A0A401ILV5_APHSA|nr:DUF547 domain-containing protein [Aphanothece sacrum]GBF82244.1 hypothetical protein AsFPU1_3672 [Aphanothece sacrum FPU1]